MKFIAALLLSFGLLTATAVADDKPKVEDRTLLCVGDLDKQDSTLPVDGVPEHGALALTLKSDLTAVLKVNGKTYNSVTVKPYDYRGLHFIAMVFEGFKVPDDKKELHNSAFMVAFNIEFGDFRLYQYIDKQSQYIRYDGKCIPAKMENGKIVPDLSKKPDAPAAPDATPDKPDDAAPTQHWDQM